jgi:hypothetical protein
MTAEEFRTALRVLDEGRGAHNIYEIEDAGAAIEPVKRAYWRISILAWIGAGIPLSALLTFAHAPTFMATAAAMMLPAWLFSARAFRDKFMPVGGLKSDEILRAAMK